MNSEVFDLVVIGAGPGGYVAAIRAAQAGWRTAVVERAELGGVCLNWGCIPTKSLLHSAATWRQLQASSRHGFQFDRAGFDFGAILAQSRSVADRLSKGVAHLLRKNKVTVIQGTARLNGAGVVEVEAAGNPHVSRLATTHTLLATGARPRRLLGMPESDRLWTSREALSCTDLPASLIIVGAGAIGVEFASLYNDFGCRVTLVEASDRILPSEDADVSKAVDMRFVQRGVDVRTGTSVKSIECSSTAVTVELKTASGDGVVQTDRALIAVGVIGNTEGLGLETTRVRVDRGHIVTYGDGATDEPTVHAIGDVAGGACLAHKASHEAIRCIERIVQAGAAHGRDATPIPACTYGHPQTASIGMTEALARAQGREVRIGRFPFVANGKAIAIDDDEGFVKTVFDATSGEVLGAHLVGPNVTELVYGLSISMTAELTEAELLASVFPHPTLSEALHESVLQAFGQGLHF